MDAKPKRKRSQHWWDWSTPIPFAYEVDASIEYVVQTINSLYRPGYWFLHRFQVDVQSNEDKTEYSFQVRSIKASSKTPASAYAEGRIYKDSRSTVVIEGTAQIDVKRFYRTQLPGLLFMVLFVAATNIFLALLPVPRILCLAFPLNFCFIMLASISQDWFSWPHRERQRVLDHVDQTVDMINKSKNPYYKPPKPIRSRARARPKTMQRRQD